MPQQDPFGRNLCWHSDLAEIFTTQRFEWPPSCGRLRPELRFLIWEISFFGLRFEGEIWSTGYHLSIGIHIHVVFINIHLAVTVSIVLFIFIFLILIIQLVQFLLLLLLLLLTTPSQ